MERNTVVLSSEFDGENYAAPAAGGSGIIISITDSNDVTVLTANHVVAAPQNDLAKVDVRFSSTNAVAVSKPPPGSVVRLPNELAILTVSVGERVAKRLRSVLAPVKLGAPSELQNGAATWFIGRCGTEKLRSFPLPKQSWVELERTAFSLKGTDLPTGCSGGGVFVDGRLIGITQRTESGQGVATSVERVTERLRDMQPDGAENRNLLEPYGTVAFDRVPYRASYQLAEGPQRDLFSKNNIPVGNSTFSVRLADSDEVASTQLYLQENQVVACQADFATPISKFRSKYRWYMLGGSALVIAVGAGFLGLAEVASRDFDSEWTRDARDRNHLFSSLGIGTLIAGAAALTASSAILWSGAAHEDSTVLCR